MSYNEYPDEILSTGDVAKYFNVEAKTVSRWASRGLFEKYSIPVFRTMGGHRRFRKSDIERLARELAKEHNDAGL